MPTLGYKDTDGIDVGNKYVTKDYVLNYYPSLLPMAITPELFSWGYNVRGELGDGTTTSRQSPVNVLPIYADWARVGAGEGHSIGVRTDGTLWTWGRNDYGQLGDNTTTSRSSPVTTSGAGATWFFPSAGQLHSACVKTDGILWSWGRNEFGQLGDGSTTNRSSPVTAAGVVSAITLWNSVSCGTTHSVGVKIDGTLWTWGYGGSGELGQGASTNRSSPGTTSGGGTNWRQGAAGYQHSAGIKADGTLWTWGNNTYGRLGDGSTTNRSSPVTVSGGGTTWKQVAAGYFHTAAVKTDGTLWAWGENESGRLGDGSTTVRSSPVSVTGGGISWRLVSCGYKFTAAMKTDGSIWTWGDGLHGALGDNTTTDTSSPITPVVAHRNWKNFSAGYYHMLATKEAEDW